MAKVNFIASKGRCRITLFPDLFVTKMERILAVGQWRETRSAGGRADIVLTKGPEGQVVGIALVLVLLVLVELIEEDGVTVDWLARRGSQV